jgi:LPXTG-site transpeptidase (sortase) family protein
MTLAPRIAGAAMLALLLAACGNSVPKVQLASTAPSSAPGSAAASVAAPASGPAPAPSSPQPTPDTVATKVAQAQAAAGSGVATGVTVPNTVSSAPPSSAPAQGANITRSVNVAEGPNAGSANAAGATSTDKALPAGSRLRIPSIGVDAPMEGLGVDSHGVMQVPSNGTDVGWYTFSTVPGGPGNAVISGHLDTATETRAVFYRLKDLKQGEPIYITEGGKTTNFEVFWTKSWSDSDAPLALILGNAPSPTLTLITCDGTFDRAAKNYSQRLVVRAKLPGSV